MIDSKFKKLIKSKTGCAVVLAGSDSDRAHVDKIVASLKEFDILSRVRICSAHKQPGELMKLIEEYNTIGGSVAFIAVAGGTDALSGILSFHALGPVISCPPDGPNESCLTNPPGSSNAYIERAENVGKFIAQIYAGVNPTFRERLEQNKAQKVKRLRKADADLKAEHKGT
jgi:phosphoribosylaminoimidazole carboxylase PurE protein